MFAAPPLLPTASPDVAVLAGTCGVALICYEFNRPGRVLPAAAGLLLLLLAVAQIGQHGVRPWAALLLVASLGLGLANAWRPVPPVLLLCGSAGLVSGLHFLPAASTSPPVHWAVAGGCGVVLSAATAILTRIAYRARRAKALN